MAGSISKKSSPAGDLPDHHPVLYQEVLNILQPRPGGRYVDGTVGAGGHAEGILENSAPDGLLLGIDLDPQALEIASRKLARFGTRATLVNASYTLLVEQIALLGWKTVDGIVLDLGVSSMQVDTANRGFSFRQEAPLDMRFDPHNPLTAADLVNNLSEKELGDLLFRYGEEPKARKIARGIVRSRPLYTTSQLSEVVIQSTLDDRRTKNKVGKGDRQAASKHTIHPATRTFQALRIAVNGELSALESVLPEAITALAPGGRLAVISFHSLEDRIVKQFFRRESQDCICPPRQPICTCGHKAVVKEITRKPLYPSRVEIEKNPRSRSARLRAAEKLDLVH